MSCLKYDPNPTMTTNLPDVRLVEVGPRDGLQSEAIPLSIAQRIELVERLVHCGLKTIEVGSFVSPRWVPQMANSDQVLSTFQQNPAFSDIRFPVLTPNITGYRAARSAGANDVAIFCSASETFSQKNINCSIAQSLQRYQAVAEQVHADGVMMRGYVSCVVACPYESDVSPEQVLIVVQQMLALGCYEVSLGDTLGRASPKNIRALLQVLLSEIPAQRLALHCHDTYGLAIANIEAGLEMGIRTFDSSVGGAGGCPYARGASGNVATEDVLFLLQQEGIETGVDLDRLVATGHWLFDILGKPTRSKASRALESDSARKIRLTASRE